MTVEWFSGDLSVKWAFTGGLLRVLLAGCLFIM